MYSEDRAEPLGNARKISIKDHNPSIITRNKRQQGPVSDGASALTSKSSTDYSNCRFLVSIARILKG
jgi:hypothetical protein